MYKRQSIVVKVQKSKIPRIRLLIGDRVALGPGKASLLDIIDKTGSISAAAREMGMSYRKAWGLIDNINNDFLEPLVIKTTGGKGGGGALLSNYGKEILTRYLDMEKKANVSIASDLKWFSDRLSQ